MNEIFYNPATQFVNTGDLLINKSLLSFLRTHGNLIIDDNRKPQWFIDELIDKPDVKLSNLTREDSIIYLLKLLWSNKFNSRNAGKQYYLFFVPGHLSRKGIKPAFSAFKLFLKYFLLKILGCKLVRVGVSLGTFDRPNAFAEALITRCYNYFAVRDYESIENAKKYNFKTPTYLPDLAWGYKHGSSLIKHNNYIDDEGNFIAMSFRANEVGHGIQIDIYQEILSSITKLLETNVFGNKKIVFVYQVDSDKEANFQLAKDLSVNHPNVTFFDNKLHLDNAFDLYQRAQFVITNRLHVMLLAMQAHTISFPFIYEKMNGKIFNIMKDNQLLDLVLNINGTAIQNKLKIENVLGKQKSYSDLLDKSISKNSLETNRKISLIFNRI